MQVGSLVELINDQNWVNKPLYDSLGYQIRYPVKGIIYTVRAFYCNGEGIFLEEIINPKYLHMLGWTEPSFLTNRFRELQAPVTINISELQYQAETV